MRQCITCEADLTDRRSVYCSNKCQADYAFQEYITSWKLGKVTGDRGIRAKNLSAHIRRYLFDKFEDSCTRCRWSIRHPITGKVPLEVEHIDGNPENNRENNLTLLCPNCHSLTSSFRNLNHGKGRAWRKQKYIKEK